MTTVTLQDTCDKLLNTQHLNAAVADGGKILIDGRYPITKAAHPYMIDLRGANGVEITGTGPESELVWDAAESPTSPSNDLYMFYTDTNTYDTTVHNLRINGSWDEMDNPVNGAQYHIFNMVGGERITLESLSIYNYLGDAFRCLSGMKDLKILNNYVRHGGRSGISGKGISERITIAYNDIDDVQDQAFDWEDTNPENLVIDAKVFNNGFRNSHPGAHVFAPVCRGSWYFRDNTIDGLARMRGFGDVVFENNRVTGNSRFTIDGSDGLVIRGNTLNLGNNTNEEGALYLQKNITNTVIENNRITHTGTGHGIFAIDGRNVTIRGNKLVAAGARNNQAAILCLWITAPQIDNCRVTNNETIGYGQCALIASKVNKWNGVCSFLEVTGNRALAYEQPVPVFGTDIRGGTVGQAVIENNLGWVA